MSSNHRNQRGNFRPLNENDYRNEHYIYRNEPYGYDRYNRGNRRFDRDQGNDSNSRFDDRMNDSGVRHEPNNQWNNYGGNYRSTHRRDDFGSGYFGDRHAYYGNYEGGYRNRLNRSEYDDYNSSYSPDYNLYDQSGYGRNNYGYNNFYNNNYGRNKDWAHEASNYERFNRNTNRWNENNDNNNDWNFNPGGLHRGKGPKGYGRSDERIREDINDRLSDNAFIDATDIEVSVVNGEVILAGTVEDRTAKRRAEDIAEAVLGVSNVENRLRIQKSTEGPSDSASRSTTTQTKSPNGTRSKSSLVES
jgi:osmotically-inducible protein OsmY